MPEAATAVQSVALTGATGFVGARILRKMKDQGIAVRALTRRPQPKAGGVEWISGDLEDEAALQQLLAGVDAIIHCAGLVKARSAEEFERINNLGCRKLCQAARIESDKSGKATRPHFILVSSLAARLPEISAYAASKHAGEQSVAEILTDIPWTVMRPPGVYGPGDTEILKLLRAMRRGVALSPGSSDGRFSLLHVDDLADAIFVAMGRPEVFSRVLELDDGCSGGYSMNDVRQIVEPILEKKVRQITVPGALLSLIGAGNEMLAMLTGGTPMLTRGKARELAHRDWVASDAAINRMADWQPKIGLPSGLAATIAWYKDNNLL